jgi:uncharacterized membrane protein YgdD (TMEM256/DUF423 family)
MLDNCWSKLIDNLSVGTDFETEIDIFSSPQSGSFLVLGMVLFCGTCYYHALTAKSELRWLTPVGGTFLIVGWLALIL